MGRIETIRHLDCNFQGLNAAKRLPDEVLKGSTFQELHHDKWLTFMFVNFVDRADVGMIKARCGTRLAQKSLENLVVAN